ncbi:hypothetical protein CVS30_08775 [Arthrobacter psychrolactophilus]|uniref:Uncharacterized protein n=1 Tax=Arthrobacter psychrolactophilus TaxID=92442 RepID=A0A2V5IPY4_9MICC|nr:hypothetical protein CVS30_08775 [Arthrobacter psychrolactophilus]
MKKCGDEISSVVSEKSVVVFGTGLVGLKGVHSLFPKVAYQISVLAKEPDRLGFAEPTGASAVNFVGCQAFDSAGAGHPALVLDSLVQATSHIGVCTPKDLKNPLLRQKGGADCLQLWSCVR